MRLCPQNFYETSTVLMVIAPLDHLWVLVNVYELDQDKVKVGQTLEIQFPFLADKIEGKVQYVASEVSKETRAVKIRASIPNPGARLKSDMLVKAILDIPPKSRPDSDPARGDGLGRWPRLRLCSRSQVRRRSRIGQASRSIGSSDG